MNILIALFHHLGSNSAGHVDGVARELAALGHDCVVAVPNMDEGGTGEGRPYRVVLHDAAVRHLASGDLFPNSRSLDVFHGWTPRGIVRKFHARIAAAAAAPFATVVHLEDNEDQLVKSFLGERAYVLAAADKFQNFPDSLTHPREGREFLRNASGVTVLIDALKGMVPEGVPAQTFWPAADSTIFHPRPANPALRAELGIPSDALVLAYTGNAHPANYREVRSLYLAVHLLNRDGIPTRLVRTGKDEFGADHYYREWADTYAVNLGYVSPREKLGDILALADVLVQPGKPDPFNNLRFPSKLPEFFATGRPVVLPRTNIGLVARHMQDAFVLEEANGPAIADAVAQIHRDPALAQRLAAGARAFYESHFSWKKSAETLSAFYATLAPAAVAVEA